MTLVCSRKRMIMLSLIMPRPTKRSGIKRSLWENGKMSKEKKMMKMKVKDLKKKRRSGRSSITLNSRLSKNNSSFAWTQWAKTECSQKTREPSRLRLFNCSSKSGKRKKMTASTLMSNLNLQNTRHTAIIFFDIYWYICYVLFSFINFKFRPSSYCQSLIISTMF